MSKDEAEAAAGRITDERLAELRKIAETSLSMTGGAWKAYDGIDWNYRVMAGDKYLADTGEAGITAHIAAFDPPTVLALLDEVDAVRVAVAQHPNPCELHSDDDPVSCGWKRAFAGVVRAIGGETAWPA